MIEFLVYSRKKKILILLLVNMHLIAGIKFEIDKEINDSLCYKKQHLCLLEDESNAFYLSVAENTPKGWVKN